MTSILQQPEAQVIASKHLFDGSGQLKWIYRQAPSVVVHDTGWVLFADNDTNEWNEQADNFMPIVIETALALAPSLAQVLDMPVGTDLVWVETPTKRGWWDARTGRRVLQQ